MSLQVGARLPSVAEQPSAGGGVVMLATFDVPFDEAAASFAVDAAVDSGNVLIVANLVELPPLPLSVAMGYDMLDYSPEMAASLLAPVERACALGVEVQRIRVKSFRRVEALVQVARERKVRMLVLGPDRTKVSQRLYRKAAKEVREQLDCLVWVTWEISAR